MPLRPKNPQNQENQSNEFSSVETAAQIRSGTTFSVGAISQLPPENGYGWFCSVLWSAASGSGQEASLHSLRPAPSTTRPQHGLPVTLFLVRKDAVR